MAYVFKNPSVIISEKEYNKLIRISLTLESIKDLMLYTDDDIPQHKIETIIKNYGIYKNLE